MRCPGCRKDFPTVEALAGHGASCPGSAFPPDEGHAIAVPAGDGVYCWACGRNRRTVWLDPDFCCRTCLAVLLTVGPLDA